jgi:transposase-like protein
MTTWRFAPFTIRVSDHCPTCLSTDAIHVRTQSERDGSRSRRYICRRCSQRYVVVIEPPQTGKTERDTAYTSDGG